MSDNTQRELRPRPPRKGRKRQIIHSSPEINEPAEVICVSTPECLKTAKVQKAPAPNQPQFQPINDQFHFSLQPSQNTRDISTELSKPYTILPGYQKIEYCEPKEVAQHEDQNYRVVFHACILLEEALNAYSEEPEPDLGGVISEKMREKNLLHHARRILDQFLYKTDDSEMPAEENENNATKNIQTPLTERIERLETKIDSLLSRNLSYSSALQSNPAPSLQPEQHTIAPALPQYLTRQTINPEARFVVEVTEPVSTEFNPLPLRNVINSALPSSCSTRVVAIRRSHKGNLIFHTSGKAQEIIQISSEWLSLIPYGETRINNESSWTRRILYLSSPCTSDSSLNQELQESNQNLQLASPARLLTPTVALLFFRSKAEAPIDIYVFATCKKLSEYRQRSAEETRKAKEGAATRHGKSVTKRSNRVEEEEVQQEEEMPMDWASVVEGQSEGG